MPRYSVATTKDKLSSLIDKALAGEEVIITRHGKPTVALRAVEDVGPRRQTQADWMKDIGALRRSLPEIGLSGAELVRQMRDEGAH